ncbi:MAG TPA: BNR repeat-containing protein, partial [Cyclobacteriaceae bacterium]
MLDFIFRPFVAIAFFFVVFKTSAQLRIDTVGYGWAGTSINTVVFRKNSIVTNGHYQYIAYYDESGHVVLAKRNINSHSWQIKQTTLKGNVTDAHNAISLIVDGNGYLHIAWNHHSQALQYCQSIAPGSLELTPMMSMTGSNEDHVTYPEFYKTNSGDLIFLYRDGLSGEGNLVMNRYNIAAKQWTRVHSNLIDGEHERNAYWQACIDSNETIHLSWVWREDWDVATNHDVCYAQSKDGGKTWQKSTGEKYNLPITEETAEYACNIPEEHELINQTAMSADSKG